MSLCLWILPRPAATGSLAPLQKSREALAPLANFPSFTVLGPKADLPSRSIVSWLSKIIKNEMFMYKTQSCKWMQYGASLAAAAVSAACWTLASFADMFQAAHTPRGHGRVMLLASCSSAYLIFKIFMQRLSLTSTEVSSSRIILWQWALMPAQSIMHSKSKQSARCPFWFSQSQDNVLHDMSHPQA